MGCCPKCGKSFGGSGVTAGGSTLKVGHRNDGGHHITSYNGGANIHFSQDVSSTGKVTNRHWTEHPNKGNGWIKRILDKLD